MSCHRTIAIAAALALSAGGASAAKPALKGAQLSARIDLATARRIALKARPGKIIGQELEKEKGGSGLRYSFDVTSGGKPYEVGVDARTGKVLENVAEGSNPD